MRDKELKLEDVEASHTLDGAGTLRWYLRRGNCASRSSFFCVIGVCTNESAAWSALMNQQH